MSQIARAAAAAADAEWDVLAEMDEPTDAIVKNVAVAAYRAAYRVLRDELCPHCAHTAAYNIATQDVVVHADNPVAVLN